MVKVRVYLSFSFSMSCRCTRKRISSAALLVKVTARIFHGATPFSAIRYAIRCAMTRVLPEPAPARISSGPSVCWTAICCSGFKEERKSVITVELSDISFNHMSSCEQNLQEKSQLRRLHRFRRFCLEEELALRFFL